MDQRAGRATAFPAARFINSYSKNDLDLHASHFDESRAAI
jgi:hypothetical protein